MNIKNISIFMVLVVLTTGCVFTDNLKHNFLHIDVPEVEIIHIKMDKSLKLSDKQAIIESILQTRCLNQTSYVDYQSLNGRVQGYISFKECFEAIEDGYIIRYSSKSNLSKSSVINVGDYSKLGKKVTDAKSKIKNQYLGKEKQYILNQNNQGK